MQNTTHSTTQRGQRTFYALALAQTISQIGSNMSFLGVGIYVYQQTGQATPLALLMLSLLLPRILAGGVAGVLADRYDRRTLMIAGDAGAALGSLALVISLLSGNFQVWHVYAAALWQALFSTLQRPAFEASVTQLVPDEQRHRANAILQMSGSAALLVASAMTGMLYPLIGVIGTFLIDLASFLVGVVTTLLVRIPAPPRSAEVAQAGESMLKTWGAGMKFLWSRLPLFILIVEGALFSFFVSSAFSLMTPYVLARTGSEPTLGFLTALTSLGGVAGSVLIGAWGGFKRRVDTIVAGVILVSITTMWFGTNQSPMVMGAALFLTMAGTAIINAMLMTLLQAKIPGEMQGRVFAIYMQLALLPLPLGYLMVGPLADQVFAPLASTAAWTEGVLGMWFGAGAAGGMGALFTLSGVLSLISSLFIVATPSVRRLEATLPTYTGAADAQPVPAD